MTEQYSSFVSVCIV